MTKIAVEIIGWVAAVLLLAAYALVSTGRLEAKSNTYQLLNVAGAAGFIINSGWNGAFPSAAVNVLWMIFGLFALARNRATPHDSSTG